MQKKLTRQKEMDLNYHSYCTGTKLFGSSLRQMVASRGESRLRSWVIAAIKQGMFACWTCSPQCSQHPSQVTQGQAGFLYGSDPWLVPHSGASPSIQLVIPPYLDPLPIVLAPHLPLMWLWCHMLAAQWVSCYTGRLKATPRSAKGWIWLVSRSARMTSYWGGT